MPCHTGSIGSRDTGTAAASERRHKNSSLLPAALAAWVVAAVIHNHARRPPVPVGHSTLARDRRARGTAVV